MFSSLSVSRHLQGFTASGSSSHFYFSPPTLLAFRFEPYTLQILYSFPPPADDRFGSSFCALPRVLPIRPMALLIFLPRPARARIVPADLGPRTHRLRRFSLRRPRLILQILLLPFLLALERPRKIRQPLRRFLRSCCRARHGRCRTRTAQSLPAGGRAKAGDPSTAYQQHLE